MAARKSSRVNRKYNTKYRIRNWKEYERGLRSRGDALFAAQTLENDPNLLFGRKSAAGPPPDLTDCRFAGLLLLCWHWTLSWA